MKRSTRSRPSDRQPPSVPGAILSDALYRLDEATARMGWGRMLCGPRPQTINLRKRFRLRAQRQGIGKRYQCNLVKSARVQHGKAFGIQAVWHL